MESCLGAISKLKKKYVNNSNSNYMFIFEPDCVDRDIKSGDNGSEMIGNGNYKVSTEGKGCYLITLIIRVLDLIRKNYIMMLSNNICRAPGISEAKRKLRFLF